MWYEQSASIIMNKTCSYCGKTKVRLGGHERYCSYNPNREHKKAEIPLKRCEFCGLHGFKFLGNHTRYCSRNPDCIPFEESRRAAVRESAKNRRWTDSSRRKLSRSMRAAVERSPETYSGFNRWKNRSVIYNGHIYHSSWEVIAVKYFESCDIRVTPNNKSFPYVWKGHRSYTPDLYLPSYGVYIEVKGRKTSRDDAKWRCFPGRLLIVSQEFIRIVRSGTDLNIKGFLRRFKTIDQKSIKLDPILRALS